MSTHGVGSFVSSSLKQINKVANNVTASAPVQTQKAEQESELRKTMGNSPKGKKLAESVLQSPAWAHNENTSRRKAIIKAMRACKGDVKKMAVIRSIVADRQFLHLDEPLAEKVLARTVKDPAQIEKYGKAYLTLLKDPPFAYARGPVKARVLSKPLEWAERSMTKLCTTRNGRHTAGWIPDEYTVERDVHKYLAGKHITWGKRLFQSVKVAAWENVANNVRNYTKFFREHWYEMSARRPGMTLGELWARDIGGESYWKKSFWAQQRMGKMVGCVADFDEHTRHLVCKAPYETVGE